MRTDNELEDDGEFVLKEIHRLSTMGWDQMQAYEPKSDFLCQIKGAPGATHTLGLKAADRLSDLTGEAIDASQFRGRVDLNRTLKLVIGEFGREFLRADRTEYSGAELRELLVRAVALAGEECGPRVHFIPCSIGLRADIVVELGPVHLMPAEQMWSNLASRTGAYLSIDDPKEAEWRETTLAEARRYYGAFSDVAVVRVPTCDQETSKVVALEAAQAAIDLIHLQVGAAYTNRMRIGGPPIRDKRAEVRIERDDTIEIIWSSRTAGGSIGGEWWSSFNGSDGVAIRRAAGIALSCIAERRDPGLYASRFLDACAWFGDAAREPSAGAAVVKYITAMERLLWFGEESAQGTMKRVAERAAALCFRTDNWDMQELAEEVRNAYELRSSIVHGRVSKGAPEVQRGLRLCERLSRDLVSIWVERFGGAFERDCSLTELQEYLDGFVTDAREKCRVERRRIKAARRTPKVSSGKSAT